MHHFVRTLFITGSVMVGSALGGCSDDEGPAPHPAGSGSATRDSTEVSNDEGTKALQRRKPAPDDSAEVDPCNRPVGRHSPECNEHK